MDILPSISDAERLIGEHVRENGGPILEPVRVLDIVACYSDPDGLEIFAVVEGAGGNRYRLGSDAPEMMTVNRRAAMVERLMDAWTGEPVAAGGDVLLVAGHAGGPMATAGGCEQALLRHVEIEQFGKELRSATRDLSAQLRTAEQKISASVVLLVEFEELADAVSATGVQLAAVGELWRRLDRLMALPLERSIGGLCAAIEAEASHLHSLRTDVADVLSSLDQSLQQYHAEYTILADRRRQNHIYRESERQRISAEYCSALLDPLPIDIEDAERECDEAEERSGVEPDDRDSQVKLLLTLRLRCLKSLEKDSGCPRLEGVIDKINRVLHKAPQQTGSDRHIEAKQTVNPCQLKMEF